VTLSAPELLNATHQLSAFDCGNPDLNNWLRKRALTNQGEGASRTYVVTESQRIVGYYALAAGGINVTSAPGRFRRNMPNPIPVALLGRMAVDRSYQGQGLGRAMFRDGAKRIIHAADTLGIRAGQRVEVNAALAAGGRECPAGIEGPRRRACGGA
jgi:GNAT superfamily N-acetyltransferase